MFLAQSKRTPVADIIVSPDRQRKEFPEEELRALADSIKRIGLIHPIVIDSENNLLAGERRLRAVKLLGWDKVDTRFNNTEDQQEKKIIELEENLKRANLTWKEEALATAALHAAFVQIDPEWTDAKTADAIGIARNTVATQLGLAQEISSGNKAVLNASKQSEARTAIQRERRRERDNLVNTLFDKPATSAEAKAKPDKPLVQGDFLQWAPAYSGEKFTVIHCDFPYGVNMDKSGQVSQALDLYDDSPDVYFKLLDCFVKHYFNFAHKVSHIMFWFSMNFYTETIVKLNCIPGARVFPYPLIWHKSDGRGMMPDSMREGRRTYETALQISVGDRTLIKPVANSFAHPLDPSREHQARKPPGMLEHFLQMYVGPGDRLFDPTAGSGASLVAGRSLGAEVFGLEINPEIVDKVKI